MDTTLTRIHKTPWIMFLFNVFLLTMNAFVRLQESAGRMAARVTGRVTEGGTPDGAVARARDVPHRMTFAQPRILLIVEESVQQCYTYRVAQKLEQLRMMGWDLTGTDLPADSRVPWISWREYNRVREIMHYYDVLIFYRVPGFPDILSLMEYARSIHRVMVYDIDDLIFDEERLKEKFRARTGQLPRHELNAMMKGAELYRQAMLRCDYAICSTAALAAEIEKLDSIKKCYVLPNGVDQQVLDIGPEGKAEKSGSWIDVFYGSGTKTHDQDFELVAAPLAELLARNEQVRLIIVGHLTVPRVLDAYHERIIKLPLMDFANYLEVLSVADISIAPLEPGIFADCKSEIKWLEAGALGVPSVVSETVTYRTAVTHGKDGYIAKDATEWLQQLSALAESKRLREEIGAAARAAVVERYGMEALAAQFRRVLGGVLDASRQLGTIVERSNDRPRIVFVNTVYPPAASGGATVVVENIVEELGRAYSDSFQVMVFTCDVNNAMPYQLNEYIHNGVVVTALSMPTHPDLDWNYRDEEVKRVFTNYLYKVEPDIIHYHSVQRLTGSIVEAARELGLPYLVTVHDAWWISDHQFLIDDEGKLVDEVLTNPIDAVARSKDPHDTIDRLQFLRKQLDGAAKLLTVSRYQNDLYALNGFSRAEPNINGVDPLPDTAAPLPGAREEGAETARPLRLGYLGGISTHKGYYLLRQAAIDAGLQNLEFRVVDFDADQPSSTKWGNAPVRIIPQVEHDAIGEFYRSIDILVAPSVWPESFGLVTREAALAGKWIICSDSGGIGEVVRQNENGWIFEAGNQQALTDILKTLDRDPGACKAAPRIDIDTLDIRPVSEQVGELVGMYNELLNHGTQHEKPEEKISAVTK